MKPHTGSLRSIKLITLSQVRLASEEKTGNMCITEGSEEVEIQQTRAAHASA